MDYPLCPCPMKIDLEESNSKIVFLQENWPSLACEELFNSFPKQELKCAHCLLGAANHCMIADQGGHTMEEKKRITNLYQKITELYYNYQLTLSDKTKKKS